MWPSNGYSRLLWSLPHPVPHVVWVRLVLRLRNKAVMIRACTMLKNRVSANISSRTWLQFFWVNTQKFPQMFWENSILFSVTTVPFGIPTNSVLISPNPHQYLSVFWFLYIFTNTCLLFMINEINRLQKDKYCMIPFTWGI